MEYNLYRLDTASSHAPAAHVLIIYTCGTFGIGINKDGAMVPFNFRQILDYIPNLKSFDLDIEVLAFADPVDFSNISPKHWIQLGEIIDEYYSEFDGFIVLHGTDTMAYTASATSFMLENLSKPVVFTGGNYPSQHHDPMP